MKSLRYLALVGNVILVLWMTYNGIDEGFKGTPMQIFSYVFVVILLALNTFLVFRGKEEEPSVKSARLTRIMALAKENGSITNDEVEEMLGVSNTTVGRYLNELEAEGKLEQIGKIGKGVTYRLR